MDRLLEKCGKYREKKDPNGAQGGGLADAVFRRYRTFNISDVTEEQSQWERWKKIAFRRFPPLGPRDRLTRGDVRVRLRELQQAGYEIKPGYTRLRKREAWNYFKQIKRDITARLSAFG